MRSACVVAVMLLHATALGAPGAMEPDTLDVPAAESSAAEPASQWPAVPSFELPSPAADDFDPSYLRLRGRQQFDTDVTVTGHIIWIYDCVLANQALNETRKATQKRIDAWYGLGNAYWRQGNVSRPSRPALGQARAGAPRRRGVLGGD